MQLKQAVQTECQQSGRSMSRIAIAAGIAPGLFTAYAQGKRPNLRNAERVAAALNRDPRDLFTDFDHLRTY